MMRNNTPTTIFNHRCIDCIRPYTLPICSALKANTHATIITGNDVPIANRIGSRYPTDEVADIGISIPK